MANVDAVFNRFSESFRGTVVLHHGEEPLGVVRVYNYRAYGNSALAEIGLRLNVFVLQGL